MKRSLVYKFNDFRRVKDIEDGYMPSERPEKSVMEKVSASDAFLKIVYQCDPRTKVPTGDLRILVSDKVSPEVKQWVINNLQFDVSAAKVPSPPAGISDDDVMNLARQNNESRSDYLARVNQFMLDNKEVYDRLSEDYLRSVREKQYVSSQPKETAVSSE